MATKPKSEDATGIISFSQQFLSGTSTIFFGGATFWTFPKTEAKGLQKIGQCVSWGKKKTGPVGFLDTTRMYENDVLYYKKIL